MMNLVNLEDWSRKHALVGVFLLMLLVAGYYFGHQSLVAPAEKIAEQLASIPVPEAPPEITDEEKAAIDAAVPAGGAGDVLGELERLAAESGASILSVESGSTGSVGASVYRGDLGSEAYSAQIKAPNQGAVNAFLSAIDQNPRYMRVESVRVKNEDGVRLDMGLTVFFQQ